MGDSPRLNFFFSSSPPKDVDSSRLAVPSFSFSLSASPAPLPPPSSSPVSASSSPSSSASLSGAPKGFAGLSLLAIGCCPGEAKLPVLVAPSTLPNALPPPKPPPNPLLPNPPPPKPLVGLLPLIVPNGDWTEASGLPKVSFGGTAGAAVDGVDEAAPKPANGDGEDAAPPPKTLLFALIAANGDEVEDASLAKPEASKADVEVCC